jgi:hypothetical protein
VKVAVIDLAALMVTTQVAVPEHPSPDQPVKVEPVEATAVRVTTVLFGKLYKQVEPQLMPLGELVTVPVPVPTLVTSRVTPAHVTSVLTKSRMVINQAWKAVSGGSHKLVLLNQKVSKVRSVKVEGRDPVKLALF